MSTSLDQVLRAVEGPLLKQEITDLRAELRRTKLSNYKVRRNILDRLAEAERRYNDLMNHVLADQDVHSASLFQRRVAYNKFGLLVILELSLDGTYYANPAPRVPASKVVYVRAVIDEAHHGDKGIPLTHDMFRLRWTIPSGFTPLDTIPRTGHDVYAVCWPLVITRRFRAPATSTNRNWLLDVYPYERVD